MFRDKIIAKFIAGKGGDGHVTFGRDQKPSGGNGGNGGSIYLEGSTHVYDLSFINRDQVFQAGGGERGGKNNLTGKNGDDVIIQVPLTTRVFTPDGEFIFEIGKPGERKLLVKGGRGGLGNQFFRKAHGVDLYKSTPGKPGEELEPKLMLELYSDVIFIGLPNAGKSSVLREITNADAKVGAYPFTTLIPQQGRIHDLTLMDLPGLIEGTAYGKGVGTGFIKHTKSARILAHFLSLESDDLKRDYNIIRDEIKKIGEGLDEKKEIIVLTKSDSLTKDEVKEKMKVVKKLNPNFIVTSTYDIDSLNSLSELFVKELGD